MPFAFSASSGGPPRGPPTHPRHAAAEMQGIARENGAAELDQRCQPLGRQRPAGAAALPRRDHGELASIAREHAHTADDKATIDAWEAHWLQADNTTRLVDHRQPGDHRPWTDLAHELGMHTERINPSQIQSGDLLVANSRGASALLAVTDHSPDATMGMLARTRDGGRPFLLPDVLAFRERRWPASRSGNRELWRITRG